MSPRRSSAANQPPTVAIRVIHEDHPAALPAILAIVGDILGVTAGLIQWNWLKLGAAFAAGTDPAGIIANAGLIDMLLKTAQVLLRPSFMRSSLPSMKVTPPLPTSYATESPGPTPIASRTLFGSVT